MLRTTMNVVSRGALISCALLAGSAGAQTCVEPAEGMRGWWPADGDSIDVHAGLHGVALNGTSYGPGMVGDSFVFDGLGNGQDDGEVLPGAGLPDRLCLGQQIFRRQDGDETFRQSIQFDEATRPALGQFSF